MVIAGPINSEHQLESASFSAVSEQSLNYQAGGSNQEPQLGVATLHGKHQEGLASVPRGHQSEPTLHRRRPLELGGEPLGHRNRYRIPRQVANAWQFP